MTVSVVSALPRATIALLCLWLVGCASASPTPAPTAAPAQPTAAAAPKATSPASPVPATAAPTSTPQPAPAKVRVGHVEAVSDSGLYIAAEKGYFKEQGIELDLQRFNSATQMVAPLAAGQLDVGGGSPGPGLYNAVARDITLRVVADKGRQLPGYADTSLVVRKDLADRGDFVDYSSLKGKTIAVSARGIASEIMLDLALQKGGLTQDDANVVVVPVADQLTALSNGSIDVAVLYEPFVTTSVERGLGVRWKGFGDEVAVNFQSAVVLFSSDFATKSKDVATRYMVAYLKGVRDYNNAFVKGQGRDAIISILTKSTSIKDPAVFAKMSYVAINPDGRVETNSLGAQLKWFDQHGLITGQVDLAKVVDQSFVESALQRLGPYK